MDGLPSGPYVYTLSDAAGVFYVGKGRGRRMYAHERDARRGKPGAKCDRIRETLAAGGSIECRVVSEHETDREAYEAEKACIARFKALTNRTAGGGGIPDNGERQLFRSYLDAIALRQRVMPFGEWVIRRRPADPSVWCELTESMDKLIEHLGAQVREQASQRTAV